MLRMCRNYEVTFIALFSLIGICVTGSVSAQKPSKKVKTTAKTVKKVTKATTVKKTTAKTAATSSPQTTPPTKNAGKSVFNPQLVKHRAVLTSTEEKVSTLKEKIFRSKAQLMLLQEKLLHGVISTAKFKLVHDNRVGGSFYLETASYSIDGRPIFSRSDKNGSLNKKKKFTIFHESISPGPHRITVDLRIRGNGFGLFSYLRGYKFHIRSSYPFRAQEGKVIQVNVVPYQKGWTVPLQKRVGLKYEVKVQKLQAKQKKLQKALNK